MKYRLFQNSGTKEPSLEDRDRSPHVEVQAFLIFERVADSEAFDVSVLLQADGQFIGKTSLGIVAEGEEMLVSLRWDRPSRRFVASSRRPGGAPDVSFIPFALPDAARGVVASALERLIDTAAKNKRIEFM